MKQVNVSTHLTLVIPNKQKNVKLTQRRDNVMHIIGLAITYILLIAAAIIVLFPFYYMIVASFLSLIHI